jgi:hypothetical protein
VTRWLLVRGRGERPLEARVDPAKIRTHLTTEQFESGRALIAGTWR